MDIEANILFTVHEAAPFRRSMMLALITYFQGAPFYNAFSTTGTFASSHGFPRGLLMSMRFICRGTACIYRNGPPQSFWGLFGWFSAGVEVQYLLQLFSNWVSVSMAWPLPLA